MTKLNKRNPSQGISNRETPREEAEERQEFPPVRFDPPAQDVAGRVGESAVENTDGSQTSHKAGSRSVAQKEAESKYADRSHPASHKVDGAFGREPVSKEKGQGGRQSNAE